MLRICPSNIILLTKISLFNDPVSCLKENKGIYAYVINVNIISQKNYLSNVIKDILKIKLLLKFLEHFRHFNFIFHRLLLLRSSVK